MCPSTRWETPPNSPSTLARAAFLPHCEGQRRTGSRDEGSRDEGSRDEGSRDEAWGGGLEAWGYRRAECKGLQPGCTGLQLEVVHGAAGCRLHLQRVPPAMAVPSLPVPRLGPRAGVGMHVDGVAAVVPRAATATRALIDPEGCSPLPASPRGLQPRRYVVRGEGPTRDIRDEPAALVEAAQRGERGGDGVLAPRFVEEDPQHDARRPPGWGWGWD